MKYGCVSKLEIHKNQSFFRRFRGPEFGSNLNPPRLHRTVNEHSNSVLATESFLVRRAIHLHFMVDFSMITMIAMVEFPAKKVHDSCLSEVLHIFGSKLANGPMVTLTNIYYQTPPESSTRQPPTRTKFASKEADVLQLFEGCLDAALLLARPRFGVGIKRCHL